MRVPAWLLLLIAAAVGCGDTPSEDHDAGSDDDGAYGGYVDYYGPDEIAFLDEASSNALLDAGLTEVSFTESSGEKRQIGDLAKGNTLVVVVARGNTVPICPY